MFQLLLGFFPCLSSTSSNCCVPGVIWEFCLIISWVRFMNQDATTMLELYNLWLLFSFRNKLCMPLWDITDKKDNFNYLQIFYYTILEIMKSWTENNEKWKVEGKVSTSVGILIFVPSSSNQHFSFSNFSKLFESWHPSFSLFWLDFER